MTIHEAVAESVGLAAVPVVVAPLALGANHLGSALDDDASFALLDRHLDHGGTMIDTALVYADWLPDVERSCSERVIGRWLRSRGVAEQVLVTTKGGHPDLTNPTAPRLDAASLRLDVQRSLDNLGLARLPLWWLHRDDPSRPVAEILETVEQLRVDGLVGAWGVCNWTADRLASVGELAVGRGLTGPVANSAGFALAPPAPGALPPDLVTLDPALAELHTRTQLPLVAYSAQAKGWFDKVRAGTSAPLDPIFDHGESRTVAAELARIADRRRATPTEVALAAVHLLPFPTVTVVGPRTPAQLDSCWRAMHLELHEDEPALRAFIQIALDAVHDHDR
jgi:aryl-alcohol dehydrogenase-like predicted oxidoreductase